MKFKLLIVILFCLLVNSVSAQLSSVITSKENEAMSKLTGFIAVDQATGYAMGKTPAKYTPGSDAPMVYFTKAPTELIKIDALVLSINDAKEEEEGFWSLYFDESKDITAFVRRRFVNAKKRALWTPVKEDHNVLFKSIASSAYVFIDENGKYGITHDARKASRWELIYVK